MTGRLVVVATPIGNLDDMSPRALAALREADLVACEDTRSFAKLRARFGIDTPAVAFYKDVEHSREAELLRRLEAGETIALASDAGTPLVSDPGERLVAAAIAAGAEIDAVPGPSAVVTALVLSGLPTDRFVFEGFLPRKGRARTDRIAALAGETRTSVLFEAPTRVAATLGDIAAADPSRACAVCRELTKRHQEVWRGPVGSAAETFAARSVRGEVTVVLAPATLAPPPEPSTAEIAAAVAAELTAGVSRSDAVRAVARRLRVSKNIVYKASLSL